MTENKSKKITFRVTEALREEIQREVSEEGTTTSKWLVKVIQMALNEKRKKEPVTVKVDKPPEVTKDSDIWVYFLPLFMLVYVWVSKILMKNKKTSDNQ